jgi:hypothetical protein
MYEVMFDCFVGLAAGWADGGFSFGDFVKVLRQRYMASAELKEEDCETAWENVGGSEVRAFE